VSPTLLSSTVAPVRTKPGAASTLKSKENASKAAIPKSSPVALDDTSILPARNPPVGPDRSVKVRSSSVIGEPSHVAKSVGKVAACADRADDRATVAARAKSFTRSIRLIVLLVTLIDSI
jgi:hypothetical protein